MKKPTSPQKKPESSGLTRAGVQAPETLVSVVRASFETPPEEWRPPDPDSPRGRILGAARALFAERGLAAASTRAIADEAAVNLAMIHYYYGSKERLYERVLGLELAGLLRTVAGQIPRDVALEELLILLPTRIMTVVRENAVWTALFRREIAGGAQHLRAALQGLGDYGPLGISALFDEGYAQAVAEGRVNDLPARTVRELLIAVGYSVAFFGPLFSVIDGRDFNQEGVWQEWIETVSTVLRKGLIRQEA